MAEKGEETASRGNEWEVVSLTASTYAAAPGPQEVGTKDNINDKAYAESDAETSRALFMSGHFVFPRSQHENLPLEPDDSEIVDENVGKNLVSEPGTEEGGISNGKDDENWPLQGLNISKEFSGMPFFDEKGSKLSIPGTAFEESTALQGLNMSGKEQSIYSTTPFSSFHSETGLVGSTAYGENLSVSEVIESSELELDFPADASDSPISTKDSKYDGTDVPSETWWRRQAASLYTHAKEAKRFWSIFIAAAVMGLVILGQRWQQERWQVLQLKWQASLNNERGGKMLGPIYRLKDVIVGGHRRGSFLRGSSPSDN